MTQFAKKIKMTNGLSIIFEKNDNADIVSIYLGIKVGSAYETDDESGICHLIEHMVFKGTTSTQAGEIATLVESHGGELNAYTSLDQTVYYINLPSKHFKLGLKLIKEMVFDATMDPIELEREKEVVIEEIRRGDDSPQRVLGEVLFKNFYKNHPYRRPVIGTEKLVRGFSAEKIMSFYKKHYTPKNMILGVCGHISEAQLSQGLEDLFRFQVSSPALNHHIPTDPPAKGHKLVYKKMDINATYFDLAFQAPHLKHKDVPALDTLSHLLGESDTSLLEQVTMEKEQLVHSISTACFTPKYPGIFMVSGLVDPKLINQALKSIKTQIEHLQTHLIEDEKIERAKLLARAQLIYEQQTCEGTVRKWISYETSGCDFEYDQEYLEQIQNVTAKDILKAAQTYLQVANSTLVVLHPTKIKVSVTPDFFKPTKKIKSKKFKQITRHKQASIFELDNGIRVVLKENHRLPLVSFKTASMGGLRYETPANNGINQLLSNIMTKSSEGYSQHALSEKIEWLAGHMSGYAGRNSLGLSFTVLSEKIHQALPVFGDIILNPAFLPSEVDRERELQLEGIKNRSDNAMSVCFQMVLAKLFSQHPYKYYSSGETASVKKINASTLKKYYNKLITPKNLVIAAIGDFDSATLLEQLNDQLSVLPKGPFKSVKLKKPIRPNKIVRLFTAQPKQQAHVALGFLGASLFDKDRYALELINNILSGQGGRLFLELRDKQSLAYSVTSTMIQGLETGFFGTYIGTEPSKVSTAVKGMLLELERISTELVSKTELDRAKNYIIGNHEIDHQKNGAVAMQLVLNELYGKNLDEFFNFQKQVLKVTPADILKTAQKYITLNKYVIGIVGPKGCDAI